MSNDQERIDASLAFSADADITRNISHGIAFAYEGRELWRGKPEDLAALIRDGVRFRKMEKVHGSSLRPQGWSDGWSIETDKPLAEIADALPEVEP